MWFKNRKARKKLRKNTEISYNNTLDNHIRPCFGGRQINEITPLDVDEFLAGYETMSDSLYGKIWTILNGVFG